MMAPISVDLLSLSLGDVLHLMVSSSGRSWDDVGAACGWGPSHTSRIRNQAEDYWPTLPTLARFCIACRSILLLEWLRAQVDAGGVGHAAIPMNCQDLIMSMGDLFKELGDVAAEGRQSIKDGRIDPDEARRMVRELHDLANRALAMINGLRAVAESPERK